MMRISILFVHLLCIMSCGIYSFSGASVPKEVKTISIEYIPSKAPNAWSSTDRIFNQELKNKLVRESGLKVVDKNGDYEIRGAIVNYSLTPQTPTQGQFASAYRLDIGVQIEFKDNVTDKKMTWNEPMSSQEVFEGDIAGSEDQRITRISANIANSIFNKIFSTW